jgi:hypothetical protein
MWKYIFPIFILASSQAHAITTEEKQGEAAGRYFGAIILASEFSKTPCGKTANLGDKLINTNKAIENIKTKFNNIKAGDLEKAFSKSEEQRQRKEMKELLATMNLDNCDLAKKTIIQFIEKEIQNWQITK